MSAPVRAPARFALLLPSDCPRDPRAKIAPVAILCRLETYEILTGGPPIRNRKLTWPGAKNRSSKETDHARRRIRSARFGGFGVDGRLRRWTAPALGDGGWVSRSSDWSSPSGLASTSSTH